MADLALANSTYSIGTNDTASTLINNVTATDAQQWNGVATAAVGIETILGTGTTLKGNKVDLVERLAVAMDADGKLKLSTDASVNGPLGATKGGTGKAYDVTPAGVTYPYPISGVIPTGFLDCDGSAVSRATYADLFAAICSTATVTMTIASPGVVTWTAHGRANGDPVTFTTTGALPTGVTAGTTYYVLNKTADTFQLAAAPGGAAINTSGSQSGTHTGLYAPYGRGDGSSTFNLPLMTDDVFAPWSVVGTGTGSTLAHEGDVTISGNQNLSGVHYYTNFTLNSGVTITVPESARALYIFATNTITLHGTISAQGTTDNDTATYSGTDQPGGTGGGAGSGGGSILYHGITVASAGGAQITGSSIPFTPFALVVRGSASGGNGVSSIGGLGRGGAGGCSVVLVAPNIILASTATINTSGNAGQAGGGGRGGGGGGGGGNVYIYARTYTDNGATFTLTGGAGGSGGSGAGTAGRDGVKQINTIAGNGHCRYIIKY